jgi:hypothetical protein
LHILPLRNAKTLAVIGPNAESLIALEGEEMPIHVPGFSGGDRTDIDLPVAQKKLLEAVAATESLWSSCFSTAARWR